MSKEILMVGGSARSWTDDDKFTARFLGTVRQAGKKDKNGKKGEAYDVLRFQTVKGVLIERNVTKAWEDLVLGKNPAVTAGDVLEVEALEERAMGRGQRFRPFKMTRLTGTDVPAALRSSKK